MGPMGTDAAAGSKNSAGSGFSSRVIKRTIGRGRGRILGPVDVMVSALEHTGCGAGCIDELHLPDITTQI
jgi:hypothetical protein